jgi:hypothetical protein
MADTFHVVADNKTTHYSSAKEAGAAFYEADGSQHPSVILGEFAGTETTSEVPARSIASTEINGRYENGDIRFVKALPRFDSEIEKDFRAGYVEALEKSVNDRLKAADWEAAKVAQPSAAPKLDPRLYDDLNQLSQNDFEKAAKAWEDHAPQGTKGPTFVDREWKRQNDEARKAVELIQLEQLESDASDEKNIVERVSTGATTDRDSQLYTEREKNRQVKLIEQVHSQFRVAGAKFYFKDQSNQLAFKDKGKRMVTASNDDRVAKAMAMMADAKGWKTLKVSGHRAFKREVWMEASLRSIEVRGYKPTEQELKRLEAKRELTLRNTVVHDQTARERKSEQQRQDSGRKTDSARHDRTVAADRAEGKGKADDDVKLEYHGNTSVTVEALKRDKVGNVVSKEEITMNRSQWRVPKSDKAQVAEAVASAFIDASVKDPMQREALKAAIDARLAEREQANKVPAVPVYDKAAPAKSQQPERTGPVVERNSERTR